MWQVWRHGLAQEWEPQRLAQVPLHHLPPSGPVCSGCRRQSCPVGAGRVAAAGAGFATRHCAPDRCLAPDYRQAGKKRADYAAVAAQNESATGARTRGDGDVCGPQKAQRLALAGCRAPQPPHCGLGAQLPGCGHVAQLVGRLTRIVSDKYLVLYRRVGGLRLGAAIKSASAEP